MKADRSFIEKMRESQPMFYTLDLIKAQMEKWADQIDEILKILEEIKRENEKLKALEESNIFESK